MRKLLALIVFAAFLWALPAHAQMQGPKGPAICNNPEVQVSSVAIAVSSATTTLLVTNPANAFQRVYICGFYWLSTGTNPTGQFVQGTGATCATNQTALTGAIPAGGVTYPNLSAQGSPLLVSIPNVNICLISTGTTPTLNGFMEYVIR